MTYLGRSWSVVLSVFLLASAVPVIQGDAGSSEKTLRTVASWDGHLVPISIYRPLTANAAHKVPVILHSHGWAGSRTTTDGAFPEYIAAGLGVVSIDMRGHGEARTTSEARVHHVDYEVRDVSAVIDFIATLPWVQLDAPGDPVLGAIGGSYGGAYQLLSAGRDGRLDAIAPEITWNDLVQALVPNGAPKSAWIDLLYGGGNAQARVHSSIHEAFAFLESTNAIPDGSVPGTPDLKTQFTASSARSYPTQINIPTLLVQGATDTLFDFNQAAANYAMIKATGAPDRFVTHLGGHILNTQGTIPVPAPQPIGLQPPTGPSPCGSYTSLAVRWFQQYLLDQTVTAIPEVCFAMEDGTTVSGASYPLPGTMTRHVRIPGLANVPLGVPTGAASFPVFTATGDTKVVGIPHLSGQWRSTAPDSILFWSLEVVTPSGASHVVDSHIQPMRASMSPTQPRHFDLDLVGIATTLHAGDSLRLVAAGWSDQFAHNSGREAGLATVSALALDVPVLQTLPS